MKLLFVAADPMEFNGMLTHAVGARREALDVKWSRAATIGSHEVLLAANGVGWKRAAAAVDRCADWAKPDAVISTGFCGALADEFQIADVVVGTGILLPAASPFSGVGDSPARVFMPSSSGRANRLPHQSATRPWKEYPALPLRCTQPRHEGKVASIDHVAQTATEKSRLRESGACAVEMEAAAVAERTHQLGLPFYCVRAVTDLAGEDLENDFNGALRSEGHFDTIHVLSTAFHQPAVRLPELWRMRQRCIRAARVLGDFFADCGF